MYDISGVGVEVYIVASSTFPAGFAVSQFADDADPFAVESQQISDTAMTLNGDLVSWSTANPIPLTINVIPDSDDDLNLAILHEANRVGQGKRSAGDVLTLVINHPNNKTITLTNGKMTSGPPVTAVAQAGRKITKAYEFRFENKVTS